MGRDASSAMDAPMAKREQPQHHEHLAFQRVRPTRAQGQSDRSAHCDSNRIEERADHHVVKLPLGFHGHGPDWALSSTLSRLKFTLETQDPGSKARAGVLSTDHGDIQTPIFMPPWAPSVRCARFPKRN